MKVTTYHLDQNVRGYISRKKKSYHLVKIAVIFMNSLISKKDHIDDGFLDRYQKEAILPFAVLEYAGIKVKEVFLKISEPKNILLSIPIDLEKIKQYYVDKVEEYLPKRGLKEKLEEKLKYDNKYAKPFIDKCLEELSKPTLYSRIVDQIAWDRFSQIDWKDVSKKIEPKSNILRPIITETARCIARENSLYALRHCHNLSYLYPATPEQYDPVEQQFMDIIKKDKIKQNRDLGDCELIHTAINGQSSTDLKNRIRVDCYTMDNAKDIKRRLISCNFFYDILELPPIRYKHDFEYSGTVYILDKQGKQKEEIKVRDYASAVVREKIKNKDPEILSLLNDN